MSSVENGATGPAERPRFIDIGVNLADPMFRGEYHGKQVHEPDVESVLSRARRAGVVAQVVTGGSLQESRQVLQLAQKHDDLFCTVGCHPTRCNEFDDHAGGPSTYADELAALIASHTASAPSKVVAVGECGLDYDRLHFCPAEVQRRHLDAQLSLAVRFRLPLFLHSRAAHRDLVSILSPRMRELSEARGGGAVGVGVVHSFDGTLQEMRELVEMGLSIGVNGCSLKTQENLEVVRQIPLDRLMLETDAPWCELRPSHASSKPLADFRTSLDQDLVDAYFPAQVKKEKWSAASAVKSRNEPCCIGQVGGVVAQIQGRPLQEVADAAERNSRRMFGIGI